jgi:two-component system NtrC family sensor kinase
LIFGKKDFGKWTEESLNKVINNSVRLIQHKMQMKELELVQELAEGNDVIYCDVSGIQHIFVALFINAIDAMSKGGKLGIKTIFSDHSEQVQIVISDTGCGIPEEILPQIFEPFVSTKESTGLGLAVVYGIVQQHKGEIEVESKPNQGTTFTITLPRRPLRGQKGMDR